MAMDVIGIVGAGQMGREMTRIVSAAGLHVLLCDASEEVLGEAIAAITDHFNAAVKQGKLTEWVKEKTLKNIRTTARYEEFAQCDFLLEMAPEQEEIKAEIFEILDSICRDEVVFATGTSSLSITRLASVTDRPEQFIGLNFIHPESTLVEVVRGWQTSNATFEQAKIFMEKIGKTPIACSDSPGFLVNRIVIPMINEAVFALAEGLGTPEAIDRAITLGARHAVGPLSLADQIGLDVCLDVMEVLFTEFGDPKYRPAPLLRKYVEADMLGRKTGRGFFVYNEATPIRGKQ